jgi:hypothetical protein
MKKKEDNTKKNRLFNDLTETFTSRLTSSQEDKVEKWKKNSIKLIFLYLFNFWSDSLFDWII